MVVIATFYILKIFNHVGKCKIIDKNHLFIIFCDINFFLENSFVENYEKGLIEIALIMAAVEQEIIQSEHFI